MTTYFSLHFEVKSSKGYPSDCEIDDLREAVANILGVDYEDIHNPEWDWLDEEDWEVEE